MRSLNAWLAPESGPLTVPDHEFEAPAYTPVLTGACSPQPGQITIPTPGAAPATFTPSTGETGAELWVMGVHGGAGESTVAALLDGAATGHRWPAGHPEAGLLLAARTHAAGLQRLREVATWWATGELPEIRLLGAVLVPDAPGRLPAPLAQLARVTAGGMPHSWQLGWHEELRFGHREPKVGRRLKRVRREIDSVLRHPERATNDA